MNTTRVSNSLDPDQNRHFVGPNLGPNCLKGLSAEDTSRCGFRKGKLLYCDGVNGHMFIYSCCRLWDSDAESHRLRGGDKILALMSIHSSISTH